MTDEPSGRIDRLFTRRVVLASLAAVPLAGCIDETDDSAPDGPNSPAPNVGDAGDGDDATETSSSAESAGSGAGTRSTDGGTEAGGDTDSDAGEQSAADENSSETQDASDEDGAAWPLVGRDSRNLAHDPDATGPAETGEIAWRHDAGTPTMNSSPVVADGVVYATGTGSPGGLVALDAETGDVEWEADTYGYVDGGPALDENAVYVGTWEQTVYAFDRDDGSERWTLDLDHRVSEAAPTLRDGTLFVATDGYAPLTVTGDEDDAFVPPAILALDPADGEELWRYDEFGKKDHVHSTPAVADGAVVFTCEGTVHALDAETGDHEWQTQTGSHGDLSPAVVEGSVLVGGRGDDGDELVALSLDGGDVVWRTALDANNVRVSPAVADGVVYAAGSRREACIPEATDCDAESYGKLYAVDLASGDLRWDVRVRPDTRSAPAVAGDTVYLGNGNGLTAVSTDGAVRWSRVFESQSPDDDYVYVNSDPAIADDRLFVGASDGHLRTIAPPDA